MRRELPSVAINDQSQDESTESHLVGSPPETSALLRMPARELQPYNPHVPHSSSAHDSSQAGDAWWRCIDDATVSPRRSNANRGPLRPASPWTTWGGPRRPPVPEITSVECWIYDDGLPPDHKTSPLMDYLIMNWAANPAPKRNGREPKAGLKLFHRSVAHDQSPFSEDTHRGLNKLLSVPPIFEHRMSSKSGFLAKLSRAEGKIGQ